MPYDQNREHSRYALLRMNTGYASLSAWQRAGYIAVVVGIALFTLFSAVVFGPAM